MQLTDTIHTLIEKIHDLAREKGCTIATAESCTGGLISTLLTKTPGSSCYFLGGVCVYSNFAKTKILGVNEHLIKQYGAVSEEVAIDMANKVRSLLGTDYGISITGIAGPDGATPNKPVGTVWLGFSSQDSATAKNLLLSGTRDHIRAKSAEGALEKLHTALLERG